MRKRKIEIKNSIHIKKGDTVQVITGKDKGRVGKVKTVIYAKSKIMVENINICTKHLQSKQQQSKGQVIKTEMPIHSSNVMLYSTKTQTASRYGYKINNNTKQRFLKKTKEIVN